MKCTVQVTPLIHRKKSLTSLPSEVVTRTDQAGASGEYSTRKMKYVHSIYIYIYLFHRSGLGSVTEYVSLG